MILRTSYILMLLGVLTLTLSGCQKDEDGRNTGYGTMDIRLSANPSVIEVGASSNTRSNTSDANADSVVITRAETVVPEVGDFALTLYKETLQVGYWDSFSDYDSDKRIETGEYALKATCGDLEKEGFDTPYYEGNTSFFIRPRENTSVEVTCYLANVKVNVLCSDAVKKYFTEFKVSARSQLGNAIEFDSKEERPFYLKPGTLTITAAFKKQNGKGATVELARIKETEGQQHYIVNVDVNDGNVGGTALNITYSSVTADETVKIDLSDAALNTNPPFFKTSGFPDNTDTPIELREGTASDLTSPLKVTLNARAGIKSCVLNLKSAFLQSVGIPNEVDLASKDPNEVEAQELLKMYGLKTMGLDESMDRMALIDLSGLVTMLQYVEGGGDDTYTLTATDVLSKTTEKTPVSVMVRTRSNQFALLSDAVDVMIGGTESQVSVSLDALPEDIDKIIFEYKDGEIWKEAVAEHISTEGINHVVKIKDLAPVSKELVIRARYGSKISVEKHLGYYIPEFRIEPIDEEVWPQRAALQIVANSEEETNAVAKYISWKCNGQSKTGVKKFSLMGLTSNTEYLVEAICNEGEDQAIPVTKSFRTEGGDLENWNFEGAWSTFFDKDINNGGPHTCKTHWAKMYYSKRITTLEPIGWATVNSKTMHKDFGVENTWYTVSSLDQINGYSGKGVCLRNVAWDNAGGDIENVTSWNEVSIGNLNTPSKIQYKAAGRLFLGAYSYDHSTNTEIYDEGIPFTSRPSSISFQYKYIAYPVGADQGYVKISLEHREEGKVPIVLAESYLPLEEKNDYGEVTIELDYKEKGFTYNISCPKATHLSIMFCSSVEGKTKSVSDETAKIRLEQIANCKSIATITGSELFIDNVKLGYEK